MALSLTPTSTPLGILRFENLSPSQDPFCLVATLASALHFPCLSCPLSRLFFSVQGDPFTKSVKTHHASTQNPMASLPLEQPAPTWARVALSC